MRTMLVFGLACASLATAASAQLVGGGLGAGVGTAMGSTVGGIGSATGANAGVGNGATVADVARATRDGSDSAGSGANPAARSTPSIVGGRPGVAGPAVPPGTGGCANGAAAGTAGGCTPYGGPPPGSR